MATLKKLPTSHFAKQCRPINNNKRMAQSSRHVAHARDSRPALGHSPLREQSEPFSDSVRPKLKEFWRKSNERLRHVRDVCLQPFSKAARRLCMRPWKPRPPELARWPFLPRCQRRELSDEQVAAVVAQVAQTLRRPVPESHVSPIGPLGIVTRVSNQRIIGRCYRGRQRIGDAKIEDAGNFIQRTDHALSRNYTELRGLSADLRLAFGRFLEHNSRWPCRLIYAKRGMPSRRKWLRSLQRSLASARWLGRFRFLRRSPKQHLKRCIAVSAKLRRW